MSGRVRLAVVGAGWWSSTVHLPAAAADPRVELVGVCDADPERARAAAEMFGARRWTTDVQEMAAWGPDAAVVATPHDAHHEPACALLDAGVDVLVEKPMTIHPRDAWRMIAAADRSGARLHVGYPFLHSAQAAALRRVVTERAIGTPVLFDAVFATAVEAFYRGDVSVQTAGGAPFTSRPDTYASVSRGGGQLLTQATHAVAMGLWCLEEGVEAVSAMLASPGGGVDVVDALTARTAGGTVVSVASTGSVHDNDVRLERYAVFGASGHALLDTVADTLDVYRPRRPPERWATAADGPSNAVRAPLAALLRSRLEGVDPVVDGRLGARVVEVLWAARRAASGGAFVAPTAWSDGVGQDAS